MCVREHRDGPERRWWRLEPEDWRRMKQLFFRVAMTLGVCALMSAAGPTIDKAKLEAYLRYAEGFMDNVHFKIDDPTPSPIPNFYRVLVHLSTDSGAKLDETYYLTPDGKEIVKGAVWDLTKSPFSDKLAQIPDTGYAYGPADAKVKLVIFSDFECPYCREYAKTVRDTLKAKILAWAAEKKLDTSKLESCMDSHSKADLVTVSEQRGRELGVQQTPTSFANGREVPAALPWKDLDKVIQMELKRAEETATPVGTK